MTTINFNYIDTVMIDMDGTMLDKYFDDYFWEYLVPERYAKINNVSISYAKEHLLNMYRKQEGTLNWTDIDFWSRQLNLDIPALKAQIEHLIEMHPNVEEFLILIKKRKKKLYLVTNAHYKVLELKLKKTKIGHYFDRCITSFEIGYPKENPNFWTCLEQKIIFDKDKTVFIDDTCDVLVTARDYGIKNIVLKKKASSIKEDKPCPDFLAIKDFNELIAKLSDL